MSFVQLRTAPVTRHQVDTTLRMFLPGHAIGFQVTVDQTFDQPTNKLWVEIQGIAEMHAFMLRLAMVVSGDALVGEVTQMPTVVDAQDILEIMAAFHGGLSESPARAGYFVLTLEVVS